MAAGIWTPVNGLRDRMVDRYLGGGSPLTFKVALVTAASNIGAASTTWAGVTNEVANGNGYTTGGLAVTIDNSGSTSLSIFATANPEWTASGSGLAATLTAVLYEVGGNVVGFVTLDNAAVTAGNKLTVDMDGSPAIFTFG